MVRIVRTIDVSATPEAIWELMSDVRRLPEFVDDIDRMISLPEGDLGVGYTYRTYEGIPPFKSEVEWVVTEFEAVRRQVHHGDDGKMRIDLTVEIVPLDAARRLTLTLDLRPRWFLRPLNWVLWPILMRTRSLASMDRTMANIELLLTSQPDQPTQTGSTLH